MPAAAHAFDRADLMDRGEVYLVALHDTLQDETRRCGAAGKACTGYFQARTDQIESGAEAYLLPIVYDADVGADREAVAAAAYDETFSLITSEAADRAPYAVARLQVTYEGWASAAESGDDTDIWQRRWTQALLAFYGEGEDAAPPALVSSIAPQKFVR